MMTVHKAPLQWQAVCIFYFPGGGPDDCYSVVFELWRTVGFVGAAGDPFDLDFVTRNSSGSYSTDFSGGRSSLGITR